MSLDSGNGMYMPVAPIGYGNNYNGGFGVPYAVPMYGGYGGGFGNGFGGDWSALIVLFLFAAMFGGGFGGMGMGGMGGFGMFPWLLASNANNQNSTQDGFNQAATAGTLSGIQTSITTGFSNAEVANCNRAMNQQQTEYTNAIAALQRSFDEQTANTAAINGVSNQLSDCCCENRLATQSLQNVVQTEAAATRAAATANTQAILDKLCDQELQAERRENAELRSRINMLDLAQSQATQTARLLADNAAQTQQIENYVRPQINPAYIVPNPYAYNFNPIGGWNGGYGGWNNGFGNVGFGNGSF